MYKALIISDIHLGSEECRADLLLKVLDKYKSKKIIIAGDFFDHHNLKRFKKKHWEILSKLRKLSKKSKIIYLMGNHCFLKAEFMSILLGFRCKNELIINNKNEKILIVHGDIFDLFFTKYRWLGNLVIKIYYLFRKTPYSENFFKIFKHHTNDFIEKSSKIKLNALKYIKENNFDKVICGHSHVPEFSDKYINLGSFCEKRCSFLLIDKKDNLLLKYIDNKL